MSETLESVLIEAINDEYKACATYRLVISTFGEIRPFINIVEAEGRHIEALLPLFAKYNIVIYCTEMSVKFKVFLAEHHKRMKDHQTRIVFFPW